MDKDRRMKMDVYRIEPYYGQAVVRKEEPGIYYVLTLPRPLDKDQMGVLLNVISQMRPPRDYTSNSMILYSDPRFEE